MAPQFGFDANTAKVSASPVSCSMVADTSTMADVEGGTVPSEMMTHVWIVLGVEEP